MGNKGLKFLAACLLLLIAIPVFYYTTKGSLAYVHDPMLCDGDKLEKRKCRQCGGTGKDEELGRDYPQLGDRCPFCRGKGMVDVILPGPKRPTRIWGVAIDGGKKIDWIEHPHMEKVRGMPTPFIPQKKYPGAIAGATVTFIPERGEPVAIQSSETGRFSKRLPTGLYTVRARAFGYAELEGEIEVKPLTEPIWLERATLIAPGDTESEAQSEWGLHLFVGLSRDEGEGYVRLEAGSP